MRKLARKSCKQLFGNSVVVMELSVGVSRLEQRHCAGKPVVLAFTADKKLRLYSAQSVAELHNALVKAVVFIVDVARRNV